jgi:hypothetical protein
MAISLEVIADVPDDRMGSYPCIRTSRLSRRPFDSSKPGSPNHVAGEFARMEEFFSLTPTIGVPLGHLDGPSALVVPDVVPNAPTTGHGK